MGLRGCAILFIFVGSGCFGAEEAPEKVSKKHLVVEIPEYDDIWEELGRSDTDEEHERWFREHGWLQPKDPIERPRNPMFRKRHGFEDDGEEEIDEETGRVVDALIASTVTRFFSDGAGERVKSWFDSFIGKRPDDEAKRDDLETFSGARAVRSCKVVVPRPRVAPSGEKPPVFMPRKKKALLTAASSCRKPK